MKRLVALIACLAACIAASAQPAAAATEIGNRCSATTSTSGAVLVSLANASGNPPAAIPSAGVITSWKFSVAVPLPPEFILSETLKVFRPVGGKQVLVVGESAAQPISSSTQTFAARIPVQPGDLIGALASAGTGTGTVFCETANPGDVGGFVVGTAPVGSTLPIALEEAGTANPIIASVEPDADNDGFGDETQDLCPQSALFQTACPPVTLSSSTQVKKGSVTVIVTSSTAAPVTVKGEAKLGKGKKAKMNGGTQNLLPGTLNKYRLFFTKGLKNKLKAMPPSKKVTLKVTISGTSVSGAVTTNTLKLKLKGQAKP